MKKGPGPWGLEPFKQSKKSQGALAPLDPGDPEGRSEGGNELQESEPALGAPGSAGAPYFF